ncbi:type II toxin-antitoxin system RelE family toxin [Aphanothece sacrum]|uniref:RelE/StbE family addiction module toxin n=1 Tax=Aphanothece sacrum FPU1 TaxID=1920663 RepID=A0A401IK05_APHSA|nr:type II toxin-antitoxin system RelE/ParE family toxin [Aphanothece sacrum]GBF81628.1 RelE/StbE family addiction module toxin [Aphanothece sacrum FPU1]GBF84114.1 RelE/StbE family addiction module toxin [Aphanothece sacrum FPU3]
MNKTYFLQIDKVAIKALDNLLLKIYKQVTMKLFLLQKNSFPQDCKKLQGYERGYRVDQGEYRILYMVEDDKIRVFKIGKRNDDEVYRNL